MDWGSLASHADHWLSVSTEDRYGLLLLEDGHAREKIHRIDRERIPERFVHARGASAFGTFKFYGNAADVTNAGVLNDTSRNTPGFLRLSAVLGSRGSRDTLRDKRGFAVKFYTEEGSWDIVGNDILVFFIQDAIKFTDLIPAAKPEPDVEFAYLHTEATHMFMWTMSDRGIPRSYRIGFDARDTVKIHFTPNLGVHSFVWAKALKSAGQDPGFHRKDLYEAISPGIFDATKVWLKERMPIMYIGELELNRNVDECFTQTEQAAFANGHVVPGIGISDDPLFTGKNLSYFDTQVSRAGPNRIKTRLKSKKFKDHISQAQFFWNFQSPPEKMHLISASEFELDHCDDPVVYNRMTECLCGIELGRGREGRTQGQKSAGLSITAYNAPESTIASRRITILVVDGYDPVAFDGVYAALKATKASPSSLAPNASQCLRKARPDHHFQGMRSTMFDSVFIPGDAHIESLRNQGRMVHWVREAFGQLKAIGATGEAVNLVKTACEINGMTFSAAGSHNVVDSYGVVTAGTSKPESFKEALKMDKGAKNFIDAYNFNISQHKNFNRELDGLPSMTAF
ncbi:catalase-like domain-containing protein [Usnea florida]